MKNLVAIVLIAGLVAAGCGDSENSGESSGQPTTEPAPRQSAAPEAAWIGLQKAAAPLADRLLIPEGESPEKLVIRDLRVGDGPAIQPGDRFVANYGAFYFETGKPRDSTWGDSKLQEKFGWPYLIDAWKIGMKGMRVGGVRELIAPARLAYGDTALVYLIKLRKLEKR